MFWLRMQLFMGVVVGGEVVWGWVRGGVVRA